MTANKLRIKKLEQKASSSRAGGRLHFIRMPYGTPEGQRDKRAADFLASEGVDLLPDDRVFQVMFVPAFDAKPAPVPEHVGETSWLFRKSVGSNVSYV